MKAEVSQKEWEQFTTIMEKIVEMELPVNDKAALVKEKMCECLGRERGEITLDEFSAWDFDCNV